LGDGSFLLCDDDNIVYRWAPTKHHHEEVDEKKEGEEDEKKEEEAEADESNDETEEELEYGIVGVYKGHEKGHVYFATDLNDDKIVTVSRQDRKDVVGDKHDSTLKVWNKATCECLETLLLSYRISSIHKTRDGSTLLCGFRNGSFQFRRTSDFRVVKTIQLPQQDKDKDEDKDEDEDKAYHDLTIEYSTRESYKDGMFQIELCFKLSSGHVMRVISLSK